MACFISIDDQHLQLSNRNFSNAFAFASDTARVSHLSSAESAIFDRYLEAERNGEFWLGRDIDIAEDFSDIDEQKFWARIFLDTARAILDGQVGAQSNNSWKARMIYITYTIGTMFAKAVRLQSGANWWPDTKDGREEEAFLASLHQD